MTATLAEFFTNLTAQVENTNSCSELQDVVNQVFASLGDYKTMLEAQQAKIALFAGLLTPPVDLPGVIAWITSAIEVFTNMYLPNATYATDLANLATAITSLTTAINNAATRIGGGCSITIPSI